MRLLQCSRCVKCDLKWGRDARWRGWEITEESADRQGDLWPLNSSQSANTAELKLTKQPLGRDLPKAISFTDQEEAGVNLRPICRCMRKCVFFWHGATIADWVGDWCGISIAAANTIACMNSSLDCRSLNLRASESDRLQFMKWCRHLWTLGNERKMEKQVFEKRSRQVKCLLVLFTLAPWVCPPLVTEPQARKWAFPVVQPG